MRHDFCSKLVQADTNLYLVSKMASHSSIKQTEKYSHLAPKQKRNALLVFNDTLPPQAQS
jgi:site-specific recombinase XerD